MNYLEKYAKTGTRKFQDGGAMPAEPAAPAPQGGGNDIEGMLTQYAQTRDPQLAVAIADALVEMMSAQQGGAAPEGAAPAMAKGGRMGYSPAPMFKKGGKLK
jgi:hypothetical protein